MTDLGTFLKAKRLAAGWSLSLLSRKTGLSKGYLHTLESGETKAPSVNVIDSIALVYGQRAGDLLIEAGYTAENRKPVLSPGRTILAEICLMGWGLPSPFDAAAADSGETAAPDRADR